MRRIYFLVPDVATAKRVIDDLLLARIEEKHLHVIAKRGTPMEDLPEATFAQKTDFVPAMQKGVAAGGTAGVLAGLIGLSFPGPGTVIAGGILLATTLAGAGVGAWVGGMVGLDAGNSRLKKYEQAIEKGELLVMADVPMERVQEIEERVRKHVPQAELEGTEARVPAFP